MTTFYSGDAKRRTKTEMLKGTEAIKARKIANNTLEYHRENGDRVIRLHLTDILTFKPDGTIIFDTGGWKTPTTKNRLNDYQNRLEIWQHQGLWYCGPKGTAWKKPLQQTIFYDGMEVDPDGEIIKPLTDDPENKKLLKMIREYCRELNDLDTLPADMSGDCMLCQFRVSQGPDTGQSLGDTTGDRDHLQSHLEEKYFMFSLIYNALQSQGYNDPYLLFNMFKDSKGDRTTITNAVRRYFKKQLGLAA